MLNPQEGGKLDAKRHYVILAMVFGQLVMPLQCCAESPAAAVPQHSSAQGQDDIMSLGIKSSAFVRVEHPFARKFEVRI